MMSLPHTAAAEFVFSHSIFWSDLDLVVHVKFDFTPFLLVVAACAGKVKPRHPPPPRPPSVTGCIFNSSTSLSQ